MMGAITDTETETREFIIGTTGWTVDDLDDPEIERLWDEGRFEIVEGVLTQMPAARFDDGNAFIKLLSRIQNHLDSIGDRGLLSIETDVILKSMRVPRVDAVYLAADLVPRQAELHAKTNRPRGKYGRGRVTPTLIIESICPGHEAHDRVTKREWYAEAGVPNYWLFHAYARSLEILVLDGKDYRIEIVGRGSDEVRPELFPGLVIPLGEIWARLD